jgi:hypothetical protein
VKLVRNFFILDLVVKHLINPEKIAQARRQGKFVINTDALQEHTLSSENSDAKNEIDD